MKKRIITALLSAFFIFGLSSCDNNKIDNTDKAKEEQKQEDDKKEEKIDVQLATPSISLNEKKVSWNAVSNAEAYIVNVNGTDLAEQTKTSYTLTETTSGDYVIKVKAITTLDGYKNSNYSQSVTINVASTPTTTQLETPSITLSDKTVSWEAISNATSYIVNVNGTDLDSQTALSYTLTDTTSGDYVIKVKALSSDNSYTTSEYSTTVTITIAQQAQYNATPTIFLAGDSTVKTYAEDQYIGGWGQYLGLYLPDTISVHNAAQGGRSSRSFINEGRLYDTKETGFSYTFSENGGKSIESEIKKGDFLFIQFGHNDDDTKAYDDLTYQYQRFVPLGTPDSEGIYPTISPTKTSTATLPSDMPANTKTEVEKYGANYYAYDATGEKGTYKGYLKEYIDFARSKGATPVLVTPVARVKFSGTSITSGPGLHGPNFAYVEAMKQLASEEDCLLIDLFSYTKTMLEVATSSYADFVMALKPNGLTGTWPTGYDQAYKNADSGYTGIEATHYNKYGAYLEAAFVAQSIKSITETHNEGKEFFTFRDNVLEEPSKYIAPSNLMPKATIAAIEATITGVTVTDPERTFPSADALEAKLAEIPAVADINSENYLAVGTLADEASLLYSTLNVDDRKEEYKTKIDETIAKVQEITISLRPVATSTYSINFADITALSEVTTTFKINDTESKLSLNSSCLKFGGNGSKAGKNLAVTVSGKGKVIISFRGSLADSAKSASLGVSDGTTEKLSILEGNVKTYEIEFEIDGETTFYLYRASGSSTGVLCASVVVEYFAD